MIVEMCNIFQCSIRMKLQLILILLLLGQPFWGQTNKDRAVVYDIIVDAQGKGDFVSVQQAINSVPDFREEESRIYIKKGTYREKIEVPLNKIHISLIGEDPFSTILTYDDYSSRLNAEGRPLGTSGSYSFAVNAANFKATNLCFENSAGAVGQAVAVRVDGDQVRFINCRFLGFQDTLYTRGENSRQYYKNCYIEGATDFIFGAATAVFDNCELFSKKGGAYITAASTPAARAYGYVFIQCKLNGDAERGTVFLGRPWRNHAKTVFIKCKLGPHINPLGWFNWNKPEAEATTFYGEYQSSVKGSSDGQRVSWSHRLSKKQVVEDYSLLKILSGWNPGSN